MWEYLELDLGKRGRLEDEVDVLNRAGVQGWELVAIVPPHRAILKRPTDAAIADRPMPTNARSQRTQERKPVDIKFRDPATGQTWSGRGRMATWLATKVAAGELVDDYRVE